MVAAKPGKSPIPRPGENVDPKPLAADEDELLTDVLDYAERITRVDSDLDADSMQKAASLETLYKSETWVNEWLEVKPPKPNAVGRPIEPNSRNRFNEWLTWRANKSGKTPLGSTYTYRLLKARAVTNYLAPGPSNSLTEKVVRPLFWMLSRHYEDRIPQVQQIARELADGGPITAKIMSKAMSEWKKQNLGDRGVSKANREAKARNYRPTADRAFDQLMLDDIKQAEAYLEACLDKLERAKGIA